MPTYTAIIQIAVNAKDQAEACDAISEALRELLRSHNPQSSVLDWQYGHDILGQLTLPEPHLKQVDPKNFQEGEPFEKLD